MHLIRRSALRAAGSASAFTSTPRSFATTSSSFIARSKTQSIVSQAAFRRFYSNENKPVESADVDESSSLNSAIESSSQTTTGGYSAEGFQERKNNYFGDSERGQRSDTRRSDRPPREERIVTPAPGIYIGNLLFEITAADLQKEFGQFGDIRSVKIATDPRGLSKGFGYIEFESTEQATAAIEAKNQTTFEGRTLIVNYMAKNRPDKVANPPSKTLFIGNLAFEMSDADLNKMFRDIENVLDVRVAIDRRTGQPRGFAHADFVDISSAVKGMEALQGKEVYGRVLRLDYSAAKERSFSDSPQGQGRRQGGYRDGGRGEGGRGQSSSF